MAAYILRRLLLMIPTIFGILLISFVIVQFAPGGPVERMIAQFTGLDDGGATARVSGAGGDLGGGDEFLSRGMEAGGGSSRYRGAQGLDPAFIAELEAQFGLDKPAHERFFIMIGDYLRFDLGESFYRDKSVIGLIAEKMPVSISLGLWTTLLIYMISIPLGIAKATRDGQAFDIWTSAVVVVAYAVPGFLFAVLLIVLFAGGTFLDLFPLRGIVSDNWAELSWPARIADYFWHITLPVSAMVISGFATVTLLMKNSFLDEIRKQYVTTARAKGLSERRVLYGHVFRNAIILIVSGFPGAFMHIFFTGSILIETIFSLDGLGLLSFQSIVNRDYPVVFGSLYIFSLIGLLVHLFADIAYTWVDPRIDFEAREG